MVKKEHTIEEISELISLAWCDKTSFENIYYQTGLSYKYINKIMKQKLKKSSYRIWKDRIKKNKSKHEKKYLSKEK